MISRALLLSLALSLSVFNFAGAPASIASVGAAQDSSGKSQLQRLQASHIKDLALGRKAKRFYNNFETLALERAQVPKRDMTDIWSSAKTIFKLTGNNANDAREVVEWYAEVFTLTHLLGTQEASLENLGEPDKKNKEKTKALKAQRKRIKKSRKKINKLKSKIQSNIKSILEYDPDLLQQQGLENWLMVSTGLLRDEREEKERKALAESLPIVKFTPLESPDDYSHTDGPLAE